MKKNMGNVDKVIRILIALIVLVLYVFDVINGLAAAIALVLSAIFMLTSLLGVCPLYLPFGISTLKKDKKQ